MQERWYHFRLALLDSDEDKNNQHNNVDPIDLGEPCCLFDVVP